MAALNVKVYGVHSVLTGEGKDIESRKTKDITDILGMEFEGPTEDEIDRVSEGFRGMFDIEDDAGGMSSITPTSSSSKIRVDYAKKKVKDDFLGEFVVGKDANKDINEKITNGGIVIVENTVAFATYPVGTEKSIDGENWNTLTGAKGLLRRLDEVLEESPAHVCNDRSRQVENHPKAIFQREVLFLIVLHRASADATSYIAPGGTTGRLLFKHTSRKIWNVTRNK